MTPEKPDARRIDAASPCPCGSGQSYASCCEPVIAFKRVAGTAEELMRARFSAHVGGSYLFLHRTCAETEHLPFVDTGLMPSEKWTRLVVHEHTAGRAPDVAYVDFSAFFTEEGREGVLHEKAEFKRKAGIWIYAKAVRLGPAPHRSAVPKTGRNEPCPCGSGKKYKHCCLANNQA